MSISKVIQAIRKFKSFLITTHITADPDALGSAFGIWYLLRKLNKKAEVVLSDSIPKNYLFLVKNLHLKVLNDVPSKEFDCILTVDVSDLERIGKIKNKVPRDKFFINIDHHISNQNFAHINWVEPKTSSCCEMVYKLYKNLGIPLDKISSFLLYAGIAFDTGFFRYSNTTSSTHRLASKLLNYNLDVFNLYRVLFGNFDRKELNFIIKSLSQIRIKNKIAYVVIKKEFLKMLSLNAVEFILDFMRNIKDIEVVILFKPSLKKKGYIRVNIRSQGKIDVSKIAQDFGGGGHASASGFNLKASLKDAIKIVLIKIKQFLEK